MHAYVFKFNIFFIYLKYKIQRVDCVKSDTFEPEPKPEPEPEPKPESEPKTTESDALDVYAYKVYIRKHILLVPPNDIFHIEDRNTDEPAEYYQTMSANNSLDIVNFFSSHNYLYFFFFLLQ